MEARPNVGALMGQDLFTGLPLEGVCWVTPVAWPHCSASSQRSQDSHLLSHHPPSGLHLSGQRLPRLRKPLCRLRWLWLQGVMSQCRQHSLGWELGRGRSHFSLETESRPQDINLSPRLARNGFPSPGSRGGAAHAQPRRDAFKMAATGRQGPFSSPGALGERGHHGQATVTPHSPGVHAE